MLHRLCGPPSIHLSFNLAAVLPRRSIYHVSYGRQTQSSTPKSTSFTAWTTRVSNPVRSPRFRSSASVTAQRPAFATGVLPDICAFHRYTRSSSLPYCTLVCPYPLQYTGLSPGLSQQTRQTAYKLFTPNNSGQRSRPTYYRGCWHVVSRRFLSSYRQPTHKEQACFTGERGLQPEGLHPSRGVAASGLRPLCNIPHCCLP